MLEFSEKGGKLDNGGMGRIGYAISKGISSAQIPSLPGNSMALPAGFFLISPHRGDDTPGAYLPPCSGRQGRTLLVDRPGAGCAEQGWQGSGRRPT